MGVWSIFGKNCVRSRKVHPLAEITFENTMPTISDNAVCIRRWDFSETSQTVSLFTRQHGIIRGIAKGAKREKGSFSGGFDILTQGHLVAIIKPGRDLATLTEWDLQESNRHVRRNLSANRTALYMADLINHMLTDHDPHVALYEAFVEALGQLRESELIDLALLVFQWKLLDEAGYAPVLEHDAESGGPLPDDEQTLAFSASAGGVVADNGGGDRWRVRAETVHLLRRMNEQGMATKADDPDVIERANRLLAAYMREITGTEPAAMRWRFADMNE